MWTSNRTPARPTRTPSVHSVASVYSNSSRPSSMASPQLVRQPSRSAGGYESDFSSDTAVDDEMPPMWQSQRQQSGSAVNRLSEKFSAAAPSPAPLAPLPLKPQTQTQPASGTTHFNLGFVKIAPGEDTIYKDPPAPTPVKSNAPTHFSLGFVEIAPGEEKVYKDAPEPYKDTDSSMTLNNDDYDFAEKTPTMRTYHHTSAHIPGPLESQLAALMSKIVFMEQKDPVVSVTPDDYAEMSARLKQLEVEKKTWMKRHEAIWALRDEDVENNIKIRGLLAKTRRDLEGMTKLRDEDLVNVQVVRHKLAEATRQLAQGSAATSPSTNGRASPSRGRPGSMFMERRNTTDLFAAAQAAALQQKALELEKRNTDLVAQIDALKGGANIDDLNKVTAHQAWKGAVDNLEQKLKARDAEILQLRSGGADMVNTGASSTGLPSTGGGVNFQRVEMLHEEHAAYREKMGGKLQALRSEKESLQRELHRREDECHAFEVKVQNLQRRMTAM